MLLTVPYGLPRAKVDIPEREQALLKIQSRFDIENIAQWGHRHESIPKASTAGGEDLFLSSRHFVCISRKPF